MKLNPCSFVLNNIVGWFFTGDGFGTIVAFLLLQNMRWAVDDCCNNDSNDNDDDHCSDNDKR